MITKKYLQVVVYTRKLHYLIFIKLSYGEYKVKKEGKFESLMIQFSDRNKNLQLVYDTHLLHHWYFYVLTVVTEDNLCHN